MAGPDRDDDVGGSVDAPTESGDGRHDGPDDGSTAPGDDADDMSGVFGPRDEPREIVAGTPDLEHALFVLLGVLAGIASMLELVGAI